LAAAWRPGDGRIDMPEWRTPGYTELRALGSGGFGDVMLARHDESGTLVAVKYLRRELLADPGFVAAFRDEAAVLASLDDPNVVRLYEYVESPAESAIVMELIDGVSVREILTRQGATSAEAALVVLQGSLLGLAAAHARGVVHRDYKPENVLVNGEGVSKLTDFGIAARAGDRPFPAGTLAYAPPEQFAGAPASPAGDVYAATATFYECVTGRPPFTGETTEALLAQHRSGPVPLEAVPEPLRPLVTVGMAKNPGDRPADAAAFVTQLRTVAAEAYGPDWEEHGRSHLAEAALLLAALWPSGAAPAVQSATVEQVNLPSGSHGSRESQHLWHLSHLRHEAHLRHLRRLRMAIAVTATAAAVGAVAAVVVVTTGSSHSPSGTGTGSSPSVAKAASAPCTRSAVTRAVAPSMNSPREGGVKWAVGSYACRAGYSVVDIDVVQGLDVVAVLMQQGSSWKPVYGPTEGLCIEPVDLQFCPDHKLPLPRQVLQSLEIVIARSPQADLYVNTAFTPGELYPYPSGPPSIGIDNHDSMTKIQWAADNQGDLVGTATLNYDNCNPDCAGGSLETFPVKITASNPRKCTVAIYPNGLGDPSQTIQAEVFGQIDIQALQGSPPSFLVGDAVLQPCTSPPASTGSPVPGTPASTPASPPVPEITSVGTYTQGVLVYFDIHYADPGNDAEGFGFVGVNGAGWAEENHPFTSPSYGVAGTDSIAYPFNEACGTAQQYDSYVEAWIYDTAGDRSTPVIIHLVCT
jgi:eukaryotic-like serine/threonine-protein kinase